MSVLHEAGGLFYKRLSDGKSAGPLRFALENKVKCVRVALIKFDGKIAAAGSDTFVLN